MRAGMGLEVDTSTVDLRPPNTLKMFHQPQANHSERFRYWQLFFADSENVSLFRAWMLLLLCHLLKKGRPVALSNLQCFTAILVLYCSSRDVHL